MKGKWEKGIEPRNFAWIIKEKLAVSERPGGYARTHRKVRRHEEILWLRNQGFTRVVSLLNSPHNLHAYDELSMPWSHYPFETGTDLRGVLRQLYPSLRVWLAGEERVLLHQEDVGDRLMGVVAGYLIWSNMMEGGPDTIVVVERLFHKQMGPIGRQLVTAALEMRSA
ncbi:MAG: hypothetical protein ACR2H3_04515 [Acidimicrobiales bacterium]